MPLHKYKTFKQFLIEIDFKWMNEGSTGDENHEFGNEKTGGKPIGPTHPKNQSKLITTGGTR